MVIGNSAEITIQIIKVMKTEYSKMTKEGENIGKKFTNMAALKAALRKEMYNAVQESTEKSYEDLRENLGNFYNSPQGTYQRTGQLGDSGQIDGINFNGDSAVSQLSISTSTQYDPSGRDTETIYGYAENNGLCGNGNFWSKTEDDIPKNIEKSFGKHFK